MRNIINRRDLLPPPPFWWTQNWGAIGQALLGQATREPGESDQRAISDQTAPPDNNSNHDDINRYDDHNDNTYNYSNNYTNIDTTNNIHNFGSDGAARKSLHPCECAPRDGMAGRPWLRR